jgi:beta-glucosidase
MKLKTITLALACLMCAGLSAQNYPYQDSSLPAEARADDLLGRLSLEQKVSLMMNTSPAIPEFGIREYDWWNEALHGCARAGIATVFPQAIGMASSWDEALLKEVFTVAGDEQRIKFKQARAAGNVSRYHGLTVWTPNINIFRDPRWGRGQETYGEDPYLTARMGYSVVTGLQGENDGKYDKLHACLKHYAVHSGPEGTRHSFDVSVSYRDFIETYLYAFERLVKDTDVQEVMCAYQRLDGKPCCGNDQLLGQLLREKWGFKGIVVSDCGAISDFFRPGAHGTFLNDPSSATANAVRTGTDLECGGSYKHLIDAVAEGKISEKDIDVSLKRLLVDRFMLGEMDPDDQVSWNKISEDRLACAESRALSLKMARETMVLLQNNGILPLGKSGVKYAVIGPNAADSVVLNGNYNGTPVSSVTAIEGIRAKVGAANVTENTDEADIVIYVGGISPKLEGEEMGYKNIEGFDRGDRTTIELPSAQRKEIAALKAAGKKVVLVNMSGSAMGLLAETKNCAAILQAWYPGEAGGTAIADVLFGDYNPAGRLPVTFYRSDADLPDINNYDMAGRTYRFFEGKPLFEFGYGLSYTTFKYDRASVKDGALTVKVSNTGKMDGDEVVQLYVKKSEDKEGPKMALRGFRRVHIPAGQTVEVSIPLTEETFKTYNAASGEMEATPGHFTLYYGSSSSPKALKSVKITR